MVAIAKGRQFDGPDRFTYKKIRDELNNQEQAPLGGF